MDQSLLNKLKAVTEEPNNIALTPGQVKLKKEQGNAASHDELLFLVAEYIRKSEQLRIEIYKESDPKVIADKALKCISLMTGDSVFYEQNKIKIKNLGE